MAKIYNQCGFSRIADDRPMTAAEIATHDAEMARLNRRLRCEMCAGSKWKDACPECDGTGYYTPDPKVP